jgi:cytochrome b561
MWKNSLIPPNIHTPMRTWSIPLSLSALLILIFYWHETLANTSLRFSWSIERLKIPCYALVVGLFVLEAVSNILYFLGGDITARAYTSFALPVLYILVGVAIALFLLVTASRILIRLRKASRTGADDSGAESRVRSVRIHFALYLQAGCLTLSLPCRLH